MSIKSDIQAKDFLKVLNNHNSDNTIEEAMCVGTITSTNPLIVEVDDMPYYEDDLSISKYLLAWDETVEMTFNGYSGTATIHHPSKLQVGNSVRMYGYEWKYATKKSDGSYQKYHLIDIMN